MFNFYDKINVTGHLTIHKLYNDGSMEEVFDDHNIIVSGMGVGLSLLFSLSGSNKITNYQIDRFQLGLSGSDGLEVSTTYSLSSPLSSVAEYTGTDGDIYSVTSYQIKNGVVLTGPFYFSKIPFSKVTRIDDTSVRYTIVVDKDSCNNLTRNGVESSLNEIGLFMRNPLGISTDASILVAYRHHSNVVKTSDFGLIYRWTISW
jgi:hypothetical protein